MREHTVAVKDQDGQPSLSFSPVFNAAAVFVDRHLAEGRGAKPAILTTTGQTVTYRELAAQVNRAGRALLDLGLMPGDRLLMVLRDTPEFFYLFWGAIKAGLVPVPLNTLLRGKDYRYMIEDSGCRALVYSPELAEEVTAGLASASSRPRITLATQGPGRSLESIMAAARPQLDPAPTAPGDDCFWLYSSGSTGRPKGAVHAHAHLAVAAQGFAVEALGMGPGDLCFSSAKLFFAYGLGNAMYFPLWVGATALLDPERPTPDSTFAAVERFRPSLYFGVPTLYAAMLHSLESCQPDLSSLRHCVSAGEALPAEILRRWRDRTGLDILDGIGSTEALHIFIFNPPGRVRPASSGLTVPGYQARILDAEGQPVPPEGSGRLWVRGGSTASYYWNNPAKTAQTMVNGWLDTGDVYFQDPDGYFFYAGRGDDMLKVGGIWCSPFEIEAKLIEHPKVLEAAIVGLRDEQGLVKPAAYVVLKDPGQASDQLRQELLRLCKQGLAPYKYPRWISFVPELPKTATGKIQRFKLRNQA